MSQSLLEIRNVVKKFGGLVAVNDVSFTVKKGELLGVAGPNGSGKSTLFNIITGIPFGPTSGEIWFDGQRIDKLTSPKIAALGLNRTFQKDAEFPDLSARETVLLAANYGGRLSGKAAHIETAKALDQVFFELDRRDMETVDLSVYEKKQLMIASSLVMGPKILMLDEPASGLTRPEIEALDKLLVSINAAGITILLIEHVLSLLLSVAERLIVINQGSILAEGNPNEVIKIPEVIEAYLGGRTG